MITLIWMLVTALGFMFAGAAMWGHGEWKLGGIVLLCTWVWFAFPKAIEWIFKTIGRLFARKEASEAKA